MTARRILALVCLALLVASSNQQSTTIVPEPTVPMSSTTPGVPAETSTTPVVSLSTTTPAVPSPTTTQVPSKSTTRQVPSPTTTPVAPGSTTTTAGVPEPSTTPPVIPLETTTKAVPVETTTPTAPKPTTTVAVPQSSTTPLVPGPTTTEAVPETTGATGVVPELTTTGAGASTGASISPESTASRLNYCPQLYPECSCFISPVVVKCDNFDQFSQLDFKKLIDQDGNAYYVYELEISPKKPIMLTGDLDLTGLNETYLSQVELRNINGFDYSANPFEIFKAVNDDLRLFVYDSFIQFYLPGALTIPVTGVHCDLKLVEGEEDFHPIFSSFDFISFSASVTYADKLCPLAFRNSEIRLMQFYGLKEGSSLVFDQLNTNSKAVTSLNSKVTNLNIFDTQDLVLSEKFLDQYVFESLYQLTIESSTMKSIGENAFRYINSLRRVILFLDNFGEFIRRTPGNPWMANLNGNIRVNLSNPAEIAANKNKQMIITFNDRSNGQKYDWPDRDVGYFGSFPHDKLVYPRVLANVEINNCTLTLRWLYLYRELIVNQADINTTSSYSCLLGEPITTTPVASTVRTSVAPVTAPQDKKFTNTQFYVTLGVLLGAVVLLFLMFIVVCSKYKKLQSEASQVGDNYSLRRF